MTPDPRTGWATACYLNDRLSLDGRDPATYGNLAWAWGDAAPGWGDNAIFGKVQTRTDRSIRERPGGPDWIKKAADRRGPKLKMPPGPSAYPYLSETLPI